MTATNRSLRNRLLIGASLAAMTLSGTAHAQNMGERRPVDGAVAAAQAAQSAASRNAQAEAAAARTRASFEQASRVRAQMDQAQAAARQAALIAQSNVPNGLGTGGLQPASGITIDPSLWVGAKGPTQTAGTDGRTSVTVEQTQEKAILTWETFNVGRETDLNFNHQGNKNWMTLNRVNDPNANPSQILGTVKAEGSIYIINPNGVIFGGASQVNVRSLVASSLDINASTVTAQNQRFMDGLVPGTRNPPPTFTDGSVLADPSDVFERGDGVTVEAGAQINVSSLGQAVLIGHTVVNEGAIIAPDGQVVLAAGRQVYLEDGLKRVAYNDGDPSGPIRGFVVTTNNGGQVENSGLIEAERGNITLTGKSIAQNGVLAATTAINANGSIILNATYGKPNLENLVTVGTGRYRGDIIFGSASYISILPDDSNDTLTGNSFSPSQIEVYAHNILFEDNSTLYAPGARLSLSSERGNQNTGGENAEPGRLYVGKGAVLDVSGLNGVEIDMAQNQIKANLTANELADNPVLRDSALRGETVYFDARLGEKLTDGTGVANLSGWYDLIKRPVEQFMTTGGSITLKGAEIIAREGSTIDLSGGSVRYNSGYVKNTNLIDPYGRIVPIEFAQAGVKYAGVEGDFIVNHARWGVTERFENPFARSGMGSWQQGYVEGRSAGSLNVQAVSDLNLDIYQNQIADYARIFDGDVRAGVVTGQYQVDAPAGRSITDVAQIWHERPALGTLAWSGNTDNRRLSFESFGGNLTIAKAGPQITGDFGSETELFDYAANAASQVDGIVAHNHVLPASWFNGQTFGSVTLYSGDAVRASYTTDVQGNLVQREDTPPTGGVLTIGKGVTVDLGDYGTFNFVGRQANIDGTILAPGGSVSLEAVWTPKLTRDTNASLYETPLDLRPGVRLGSTGVIDVAGRWSNNWLESQNGETLTAPVVDGGSVRIVAYKIALETGSLIDVSGGAHLATDGSTLALGNGGSILLDVSEGTNGGYGTNVAEGDLALGGSLRGYAPGKGGTLAIDTSQDLYIGDGWVPDEDGVIRAGDPVEGSFVLVQDLKIPAGTPLPLDTPYTYTIPGYAVAEPGEVLKSDLSFDEYPIPGGVIDHAWVLPDTITDVQDNNGDSIAQPGDTLPAGTYVAFVNGYLAAGTEVPAFLFPDGIQVPPTVVDDVHPIGTVLDADFTYRAGTAIPDGTIFGVDVPKYLAARIRQIGTDHFTQGGFANFSLSGARGVTIQPGTIIEPTVDTLTLSGTVRDLATGANLLSIAQTSDSGVTMVNSADLPESLRQTTNLSLSTFILGTDTRVSSAVTRPIPTPTNHPGNLILREGAEIRLTPKSQLTLDSLANLSIDGTIRAEGGTISLAEAGQTTQIRLGGSARLLAPGYVETLLTDGYEQRIVQAGGAIRIGLSAQGSVNYTNSVEIDPNAVLDVSGVHGVADVAPGDDGRRLDVRTQSPLVPVEVDGDAGSIVITAASGLVAGDLRLAPGGEKGRGGSLTIANPTNNGTGGILIRQTYDAVGEPASHLTLIADSVANSGLDNLTLQTSATGSNPHGILFDGDVSLAARRSITLTADHIQRVADSEGNSHSVDLAAPYVLFSGNDGVFYDSNPPAYADDLSGTLTVKAGLIDVSGWINFDCTAWNCPSPGYGGFGLLDLRSDGDIRLIGGLTQITPDADGLSRTGGISTGGAVRFEAAQVYVSMGRLETLDTGNASSVYERSDLDPGFLIRSGEKIAIVSNGNAARVPLTFGARLTLRAPVIEQTGVLRSPGGQLRLEATDRIDGEGNTIAGRLVLASGSLTSTALDGITVPYGTVNPLLAGLFNGYARADSAPTQSIELNAAGVDMQKGAVVDVSGGGDLVGWSFSSGIGGTRDLLSGTSGAGYFAVLPSLGAAPAPNRPLGTTAALAGGISPFADSRLTVGDTVWLADVPGLAAGYYTLLPAGYAVLDGALLVRPVAGSGQFAAPVAAVKQDDGTRIVSGYRAVAGTSIRDPLWSSFEVLDGATWRQYSAVTTYSFNETKAAQATEAGIVTRTLADAGTLTVKARDSLNLAGSGLFDAAKGLFGNLEIAAPQIALANADSGAPEGYLFVDAGQLQAFGAGSVLLGGTRPRTTGVPVAAQNSTPLASGLTITTVASDVQVADGTTFSGGELLLLASNGVSVGKDVRLTATGAGGSLDPSSLLLSGDGTLLRLSAGDRVGLTRTGSAGATGTLAIGAGSVLTTKGSLSLDASAGFVLAEDAVLDVARLDLATDRINLGAPPESQAGTTLGEETLQRLAASADLLLRGYQSISVFGDVSLGARGADGAANLKAITLDTALLRGEGAPGQGLTLTAGTLTLRNSGDTIANPLAGNGRLTLDVDTLALGPGATTLGGFAVLRGQADTVETNGKGSLSVAGNTDLAVGNLTAGSGSDYAIDATGTLAFAQGSAGVRPAATIDTPLGGKLTLSGAEIAFDSAARARGGTIALNARDGDTQLGEHAVLDVSGAAVDFNDVVKVAPGGAVQLVANGDIVSDAASRIDVSGAAEGGKAGAVNVTAGGAARLAGLLVASAAEGQTGGEFTLDAATTDFSGLNTLLNSGDFNASRDIRLRGQDILLADSETIEAHRVSLRADNGDVRILGTIAAGGTKADPDGGVVRLTGRNVALESGARIDAAAAQAAVGGFAPGSGRVELAADEGHVGFASGAAIDVSGGRDGGGRVSVRAARTATGADADLEGTVTGALEKDLIGSRVYTAETVEAGLVTAFLNDATLWFTGASAPAGWTKGAGIIVRSPGDLTVANDIDLGSVSGPGWLGLEAGANLIVNANINSGFASTSLDAELSDRASFSYGFEAEGDVTFKGGVAPPPMPVVIGPGEAFDKQRPSDPLIGVTIQGSWDLQNFPDNVYVMTSDGTYYASRDGSYSSVVPEGSTISQFINFFLEPASFPAGYILPSDAFPNGLIYPDELQAVIPRAVRTGADIRVRAGKDLAIEPLAAVYSAGRRTATAEGFDRSAYGSQKTTETRVLGEFPTQGGNIDISVGGNIVAPVTTHSVSSWLFRYGDATWNGVSTDTTIVDQTNWSVVFPNFREGLGALGGGDVRVRAGGDVQDLTVAIPTSGHLTTPVGEHPSAADLVVRGGGNLDLRTSGNLLGGFFLLGRGQAELTAAGSIGEGALTDVVVGNVTDTNPLIERRGLNPVVGLMDATARFIASGDVAIEGAYDPTMSPQICENVVGNCETPEIGSTQGGKGSAFIGYSDRAALDIISVGGDATYRDNGYAGTSVSRWNPELIWQIRPQRLASLRSGTAGAAQVAPGTMRIAALAGDVTLSPAISLVEGFEPGLKLASAPHGTLEVTAQGDIWNDYSYSNMIVIGNTATEYLRHALAPQATEGISTLASTMLGAADFFSNVGNNQYRGFTPLHDGDTDPVRLIALTGSIASSAHATQFYATWGLNSPKAVYVYAGQDIVQPVIYVQHNDDNDISRIIAGRDFSLSNDIRAIGPGLLWVEAGRNYVHTTDSAVIHSGGNNSIGSEVGVTGNFTNLGLPDQGADIIIAAGTAQGADYDAFAKLYLDPANLADPAFGLSHPSNAGKVVHTYEAELESWLKAQGFSDVNADNGLGLFASLPEARRKEFLQQVLFSELRDTGIDYNAVNGSRFHQYTRGYDAMHVLFPATAELQSRDNPAGGNIIINNGLIGTRSSGNVTLLAPYGRVDIGNPQLTPSLARPGIITSRGGDLNILANGTISLGASRAFTLGGGDILMWTSLGDITAGFGSKTSVRSAPLAYVMDPNGTVALNNFGTNTGAGIGVLDAFDGEDENRQPSRLDLLAFFGEVNAGDAGIRVVGDLNIAALRVVNAANIEVSGEAVGIPQVPVVNVGALNAASNATSAIVNEAAQLAERGRPQVRADVPVIVQVRLLGFGEQP
jgi:filamentous hemagglutinin family protein